MLVQAIVILEKREKESSTEHDEAMNADKSTHMTR